MAIINPGDWPIDANAVDGTELAARLNRFHDALISGQASATRPPYITKGGIWAQTGTGNDVTINVFDGAADHAIGSVVGGVAKFGGATFNSGATATKPTAPVKGDIFFDTTLNRAEFYDGGAWKHTTEFAEDIKVNGIDIGVGISGTPANTRVGLDALKVATAAGNTGVGWSAGAQVTTGANNTAIGNATLYTATTGENNTALGVGALNKVTVGNNNTAVGNEAGFNATDGSKNLFAGYKAGYSTGAGARNNTYVGGASQLADGGCGYHMTGSANVILGSYNGNQDDFLAANKNNYVVISDGEGHPKVVFNDTGNMGIAANLAAAGDWNAMMNNGLYPGLSNQNGGFMVERTNDGATLFVSRQGDSVAHFNTNGDRDIVTIRKNGSKVGSISISGSTTGFNTSSDYRLKDHIHPMTGALDKIAKLKPVTYKWKSDGKDGQGFIAHELQEHFPEAVTGAKDAVDADGNPSYQGVDVSFLVGTLVAAIQELKKEIDELKGVSPVKSTTGTRK